MELNIKQNITADDLLQGTSWFGSSDHDEQAVENLKALNDLVSDVMQKVYFLQKQTEQIATNQHNASAREISEEAQKLLVNVVKMATDEVKWAKVDELFKD